MKGSSPLKVQVSSEASPEDRVSQEAVEATMEDTMETKDKSKTVEDPSPEADQTKDHNLTKDLTVRTDQTRRELVSDVAKPTMMRMTVGLRTRLVSTVRRLGILHQLADSQRGQMQAQVK